MYDDSGTLKTMMSRLTPVQYTSLGMRLVIHIVVDAVIVILQPPREEIPFAHSLRTAYSL